MGVNIVSRRVVRGCEFFLFSFAVNGEGQTCRGTARAGSRIPRARYILKQSTLRFPLLIYNSRVLFALKAREPLRLNPVKLRCQVKRGLLLVASLITHKQCPKDTRQPATTARIRAVTVHVRRYVTYLTIEN